MKTALAILALAAMTASAQEVEKIEIPKSELQKCREEGGCVLITRNGLAVLIDLAKKSGEKTCRNNI